MDRIPRSELVVVGVDGSEASVPALVWALRYAAAHNAAVDVFTAWPVHAAVFVSEMPGHFNEARWHAVQVQTQVIAHANSLVAGLPQHTARVENVDALDGLIQASESASLLVLGTDRQDCSRAGSWASLTVRVQHAAHCPVIVIPKHSESAAADAVDQVQLVSTSGH